MGSAELVTLSEGEQRGGLDIVLSAVKTASVSGTARDSQGRTFGSGTVAVINASSGMPIPIASAPIAPDGSFKVASVPPGRFTLNASSTVSIGGTAVRDVATQTIVVSGEDLIGIALKAPKPAILGGTVAREVTDVEALPTAVQLKFVAANPAEDLTDVGTVIRPSANGAFEASVRPGTLRIELAGAAPGWYLSRVIIGGHDVTDSGIEVKSNGQLADIQVLLTTHVSTISGVAEDGSHNEIREFFVSVFSKDESDWGFRSRRVTAVKADQDGKFTIRGLPAGDYFITALNYMELGEAQDPEFLELVRGRAQSVTVRTGDPTSISLTLRNR